MTDPDETGARIREIFNRRLLNAPRELVFRAFAEPALLAQWWGPNGFRNTIHEFVLHPGGHWRFTMHGPDGTDYHNESVFIDILPPERIVFRHLRPVHEFQMTMMLADVGGKTDLTWRTVFISATAGEKVRAFVAVANEENFDRLEAVLAKMG